MVLVCQVSKELRIGCPGHSIQIMLACDKEHGHADLYHHDWEFDLSWKEG